MRVGGRQRGAAYIYAWLIMTVLLSFEDESRYMVDEVDGVFFVGARVYNDAMVVSRYELCREMSVVIY